MSIEFTLLGTGSSGGVPRIGNDWGNCDPANPRNRRRRCSMLVSKSPNASPADAPSDASKTTLSTDFLIDTGPDMREQLLSSNVQHLDGVMITHSHADHIFGLDDLRQLWVKHKKQVDVYFDESTKHVLFRAFSYCFDQPKGSSYPPFCIERSIREGELFTISGEGGEIPVMPIQVEHGDIHALGARIGGVAYVPDVKSVELERSREQLQELEVLVIDALRERQHPSHMSLAEALAFIEEIKPARAILTNMHGDLDYASLQKSLPSHVEPGYDGLNFSIS